MRLILNLHVTSSRLGFPEPEGQGQLGRWLSEDRHERRGRECDLSDVKACILKSLKYPTQPAQVCAQDAGDIAIDGDPSCTKQTQTLDTTVTGTNGTATVSQTTGTSFSSQQTTSQESSISVGETVEVKVGIPEVADVTSSTSLTTTFTNTVSKS